MDKNENKIIEDLANRAINGDSDAFSELIYYLRNNLYRTALYKLNNNEHDAEDVLQSTVENAFDSIKKKKLKHPENFKTWITAILLNECKKFYKFNNRLNRIKTKCEKNTYGILTENGENIIKAEDKVILEEALKLLSKKERECIQLFYGSRYSAIELSKILGVNVNTIISRICRAKDKIQKYYEEGKNSK